MNLLLCLTLLAFSSCASACTVTLSIWTSSSIAKAYTQTITVPDGTTIEGMMIAAAANGNTVYSWGYLGSDSTTAYLKVDGILDNVSTNMYWAMFKMSTIPLLCGSKYPTGDLVLPYTFQQQTVECGANYLLWYLRFPKV